jgi:integrase
MARLYKRGKYWWYQYKGKRYATRCTDRVAAEAVAREIERRISDPNYRPPNQTTLGNALNRLLDQQEIEGRAAGTLRMQGFHANHLARVLGEDTLLSAIAAREIDGYLKAREREGAKRTTQGKELSTLRSALRMARHVGDYPHALDEVIPKFRLEYKPLERRLTEPQVAQLLAVLEPSRAAVCAFIVATGADWASVALAKREDFDLTNWRVRVHGTKTKYRSRTIPIALPLFRRLVKLAVQGLPFGSWGNAVRDLKNACRRAGLPRVTPRDLRRTNGYILRAHGLEPHLIGLMLGHADSTMAERTYAKIGTDDELAVLVTSSLGRRTSGTARAQSKRSTTRIAKKAGSK